MVGFEPTRLAALAPQASVSTNSTTSAFDESSLHRRRGWRRRLILSRGRSIQRRVLRRRHGLSGRALRQQAVLLRRRTAPVSGEVVEVNAALKDKPEDVNTRPHEAWMIKVRLATEAAADGLMDAAAYEAMLAK